MHQRKLILPFFSSTQYYNTHLQPLHSYIYPLDYKTLTTPQKTRNFWFCSVSPWKPAPVTSSKRGRKNIDITGAPVSSGKRGAGGIPCFFLHLYPMSSRKKKEECATERTSSMTNDLLLFFFLQRRSENHSTNCHNCSCEHHCIWLPNGVKLMLLDT